jgi:hypothetical protein
VLAGAAVLVGCAGLTVYLLAAGKRGAEVAVVLGPSVSILLAVAAALSRPYDLGDEALAAAGRQLAGLVRQEWSRTLQRLLAGSGAPEPADVGYVRSEQAGLAADGLVRWRSDGGAETGSLTDIGAYYAGLRRGRLVVLGAPGSGKTVLAVHLLLERLEEAAAAPGPGPPRVPVLLSLPTCPATDVNVDDQKLSRHFDNWVSRHLAVTYRLPRPVASALVTGGWVLPILDGLDEMDDEGSVGADGLPPRAGTVVRALNQDPGTGLRPVVLTCREHRYRQLLTAGGEPGASPALEDATAVTVQPLTPAQITGYLTYRFPGPPESGPAGLDPRWQPVADAVAADPAGALAAALGTPWRLFLAVTGYHAGDTRPAELAELARTHPGDLDAHLLGRLVPETTRQHRRPDGTRYQPEEGTRGLATLARHLAWQQAHGGSGTDLKINELWRAAGPWTPRYLHAALVAVPGICFTPLDLVMNIVASKQIHTFSLSRLALDYGFFFVFGILLPSLFAFSRSSGTHRANFRRLRCLGVAELRILAFWLAAGIAVGLAVGLAAGLMYGFSTWVVAWLMAGLAGGLVYGLGRIVEEAPRAIDRPSALLREDLSFGLAFWVLLGLGGGLAYGLVVGRGSSELTYGAAVGHAVGLGDGSGDVAYGLIYGLVLGLAFGLTNPGWPRFVITSAILSRRDVIPGSLRDFLDWTYSAGLLRLSGTSLQFRHIEFQQWAERETLVGTGSGGCSERPEVTVEPSM